MEKTKHFADRNNRISFIKNNIGIGNIIKTFRWDKGHPNGAEYHSITDTGIIVITNVRTHKLITMLIARPQQIRRYYVSINAEVPRFLIDIALEHQRKGYNNI